MKPNRLIGLGILASTCCFIHSVEATTHRSITVTNSSDQAFTAVPIEIRRQAMVDAGIDVSKTNDLRFVIGDQRLPSQLDDLDGDGQWDEAALLVSVEANAVATIEVVQGAEPASSTANKTNIHIGQFKSATEKGIPKSLTSLKRKSAALPDNYSRQYQMEGPAWENENIGFRMYFDERNGFDIFGKTTTDMVLDTVGISENYHERQSWGMDVLKVGRSLGAGALGFTTQGEDPTIQRLTNAEQTTARIVLEGPVRSILEVNYVNVPIAASQVNITQHISIWAGQHSYTATVVAEGLPQDHKPVVGFVNFFAMTAQHDKTDSYALLATYGEQAEEKTRLGMGILTSATAFANTGRVGKTESGIEHSEYIVLNLDTENSVSYEFFAVWEPGNGQFSSSQDLLKHMKMTQSRNESITVKLM